MVLPAGRGMGGGRGGGRYWHFAGGVAAMPLDWGCLLNRLSDSDAEWPLVCADACALRAEPAAGSPGCGLAQQGPAEGIPPDVPGGGGPTTCGSRRVCCALTSPGADRSHVLTRRTCRAGSPCCSLSCYCVRGPRWWQPVDRSPSQERGARVHSWVLPPCCSVWRPGSWQAVLGPESVGGGVSLLPQSPTAPESGSWAPGGDVSAHRVWWGLEGQGRLGRPPEGCPGHCVQHPAQVLSMWLWTVLRPVTAPRNCGGVSVQLCR